MPVSQPLSSFPHYVCFIEITQDDNGAIADVRVSDLRTNLP